MEKICTKCGVPKLATAEFFHKKKTGLYGFQSVCKECRKNEAKKRWADPKVKAKHKIYLEENKEHKTKYTKEYRAAHKEAIAESKKRSYEKNTEHYSKYKSKYHSNRRATDIDYVIRRRLRSLLYVSLKQWGIKDRPGNSMFEVLGFTLDEFKEHFSSRFNSGMNWENFRCGDVCIDHIIPRAAFTPKTMGGEEFVECWALSNLQPLYVSDNSKKWHNSDKYVVAARLQNAG